MESHSFLSLPAFVHHIHTHKKTHRTDKKTEKPDGKPVLCQRIFSSVFRAVFYIVKLHSSTQGVWGLLLKEKNLLWWTSYMEVSLVIGLYLRVPPEWLLSLPEEGSSQLSKHHASLKIKRWTK
jgi:hypothetical protein